MATGTTTTADLIIPEVWADAVAPVILGRTVWAQLADTDDQLVGQPGETVIFPKFDYIGDADDLTEGVAMDTTKLSMSDSRATIKEAGKAVELTDSATLAAIGNPNSQAQTQLALSVARKIDTDLRIAAERVAAAVGTPGEHGYEAATTPLIVAATADRFSWASYVAATQMLGDEYDPSDLAGLVLHSAQMGSLMLDEHFIRADSFGAGAVIQRGQIGSIGNVPVFISDRVTKTGVGVDTVYNAVLVRKGALALKFKRRPIVETDRDILKRTNIITTNVHYATKRVDDRGIVIIKTKALAPVAA